MINEFANKSFQVILNGISSPIFLNNYKGRLEASQWIDANFSIHDPFIGEWKAHIFHEWCDVTMGLELAA